MLEAQCGSWGSIISASVHVPLVQGRIVSGGAGVSVGAGGRMAKASSPRCGAIVMHILVLGCTRKHRMWWVMRCWEHVCPTNQHCAHCRDPGCPANPLVPTATRLPWLLLHCRAPRAGGQGCGDSAGAHFGLPRTHGEAGQVRGQPKGGGALLGQGAAGGLHRGSRHALAEGQRAGRSLRTAGGWACCGGQAAARRPPPLPTPCIVLPAYPCSPADGTACSSLL